MALKVIRYKNQGFMLGDEPGPHPVKDGIWETRFLFSFYELNNGRILQLSSNEYWKDDKSYDIEFTVHSNWNKLNNGQIHKYEFSMDFWEWFNSLPGCNDVVEYEKKPSKEEIDCVMEFYWKHVHEKREETQETITV
ncbi:MAG: hypothetical protein QNL21_06170 [Flavobacteriales bacterium]